MFGMSRNPIASYTQVSTDIATSADPHRLVLMLFEGAHVAIAKARLHMVHKEIPEKGAAISRAIDIISNGLKASLDLEKGDDIAARLDALYDYMILLLLNANMKNDMKALEEVSGLLEEIHSAWREIPPDRQQNTAA
jgi:flagellar protein FliS